MKRSIKLLGQQNAGIKLMLVAFLILIVSGINAQNEQSVTGKVIDEKSRQAVPFASVVLMKESGMLTGTIGDDKGEFKISPVPKGKYTLKVTFVGYKQTSRSIDVVEDKVTDAGIIILQDTAFEMKETVIVGERLKAKSESDKTTFFMTQKMLSASGTGTDALKFIPGIQVDFMQNISLEGSRNIQIFVDGKERDAVFISQLDPKQIEKVEVISRSSSNFDGNITGAINIILKKERNSGISGQIYTEIPTSGSEIFMHPTFSLNYGTGKLNLYTSYKGEITYLDIHESTNRKVWNSTDTNEIISNQYVRQKNWSHRLSYGFDYILNSRNQFNFYAFYNPYSRELDGYADSQISGGINKYWKARKEDTDMNTSTYYSMYYKHNFKDARGAITFEIGNYKLKAKNSTAYISDLNENTPALQTNTAKPQQNETSIRMDYTTLIRKKLNFSTGVKTKFRLLQDKNQNDFDYTEKIFAAYGTIGYKHSKYDMSMGLRAESYVSGLKNNFENSGLDFFPNANLSYKPKAGQQFQVSYSRSIVRPNIYQLNPFISIDDPFTVSQGNPYLKPEFRNSVFFEHSIQFKSNYFAWRLFYNKMNDAINNLTFINDTSAFETQVYNLGTIHQYGTQLLGTFKLGIATLSPYLRIFDLYTCGNSIAKEHAVENRHNLAFESGLSVIVAFKYDISASLTTQYTSPKNNIQGNSFSGALYFISLEKTFKQKIKVGIVSGLPFTKTFTYQGSEIEGSNFYSHYEGNVKLSAVPLWFKFSYQFRSGKNRENANHVAEEIENLPKKGF